MASPQDKYRVDIYTVLLIIALVAIITAIVLLVLETKDYAPNKTKGAPPVVRAGMFDDHAVTHHAPWHDGFRFS